MSQTWLVPEEISSDVVEENLTAICLATPDGLIRSCNPAFVQLFGFTSAADAQGESLSRIFPGETFPCLVTRLRHERVIRRIETQLQRVDRRPLPVVLTAVGRFTATHDLHSLVLMTLDDTPRRTLETHLRDVMRMETVGRLASAMAHDFSNLLMVTNGLGESLLERLTPDDPRRPELVQLLDASHRAATLTTHLLAASRKPAGLPTMFDLDEVVRTMAPLIERLVGPHVRVTLDLVPGAKQISADRDQLEQVLLNLVTNARDAMPHGGQFTLRTMIADGRVILTLTDTGDGMPAEVSAHIFEPFFTTKPRGKGTGLGLWQVQSILAEHQGEIDVRSEREHGTTFTIRLPQMVASAGARHA
jgi:signal transduction histidine kinase